jgi:hypothetical protein
MQSRCRVLGIVSHLKNKTLVQMPVARQRAAENPSRLPATCAQISRFRDFDCSSVTAEMCCLCGDAASGRPISCVGGQA